MSDGGTGPGEGPHIYVADLAAYNNGHLRGVWIDATQDSDEIAATIETMIAKSPVAGAEEWAIHDYQGFGGLRLGEFEDLATLSHVAQLIAEHGEVFAELVSHFGGTRNIEEAIEAMEEHYQGEYDSLEDWASQLAEDTGFECGEPYRNYIDWEAIGRDAELGGDVFTIEQDGKFHVFWNH